MKKIFTSIFFFLILSGIALFLVKPASAQIYGSVSGQITKGSCPGPGTESPGVGFKIIATYTLSSGNTCYYPGCLTTFLTTSGSNSFSVPLISGQTLSGLQLDTSGTNFQACNNGHLGGPFYPTGNYFTVYPITTGSGSPLTGITGSPNLIVDNLSPVNGSLLTPSTIHFSGYVKNIAQYTANGSTNALASKALLFIDYNVNTTPDLNYPPGFDPSFLTNLNYSYFQHVYPLISGSSQQVSWDVPNVPGGIHAYAICANMHVNPPNLNRDVLESTYADNCAYGWFVATTPPALNILPNSCTGIQPVVNLTWSQPAVFLPGRDHYLVLRSQPGVDWQVIGTTDTNGTETAPFHDPTGTTGTNYSYWIWVVYPSVVTPNIIRSDIVPTTIPTAACTPPTISSLKMEQAAGISPAGGSAPKISGRQSSEQGSNWLNPVDITLIANKGSYDIKEYYVALYNQTSGQASSVTDLPAKINNPQNGIILKYESNGTTSVSFDGNSWQNIFDLPINLPIGCTLPDCDFKIARKPPPDANSAKWTLFFYAHFNSKNLFTAGYVIDNNPIPLSDFRGEITPVITNPPLP